MSSSASDQPLNPVSHGDLVRWGLLDQVRRQQRIDALKETVTLGAEGKTKQAFVGGHHACSV